MSANEIARSELKRQLQLMIADKLADLPQTADDARIEEAVRGTVADEARRDGTLGPDEAGRIADELVSEFVGYGPLDPLLHDPDVTEIMCDGGGMGENGVLLPHQVTVEVGGVIYGCDVKFDLSADGSDEEHVRRIMERIAQAQSRPLDDAHKIADATLKDGSRFNGTLYPAAPDGSTFNIRKFNADMLDPADYVENGTATPEIMAFLDAAVKARCSILVAGGTGSGKTTLLNILAGSAGARERIITIEDTAELQVKKTHPLTVRLEAQKPNAEGTGEITLEDHLIATLRKRPDRIIVGEVRGREAAVMIEAMDTGHEGGMTTIHANSPQDAVVRLRTLIGQGDPTLSEETIYRKIASAFDLVVYVRRLGDGARRLTDVVALCGYADGAIQREPVFTYVLEGRDEKGRHVGHHAATGSAPRALLSRMEERGIPWEREWFSGGRP